MLLRDVSRVGERIERAVIECLQFTGTADSRLLAIKTYLVHLQADLGWSRVEISAVRVRVSLTIAQLH